VPLLQLPLQQSLLFMHVCPSGKHPPLEELLALLLLLLALLLLLLLALLLLLVVLLEEEAALLLVAPVLPVDAWVLVDPLTAPPAPPLPCTSDPQSFTHAASSEAPAMNMNAVLAPSLVPLDDIRTSLRWSRSRDRN
jgi:hypothetical protein